MLQISIKKLIWIVLLIIIVIVFFLSLWLSSRKECKVLEKENIALKARLDESYQTCERMVEEKYYLYDVVQKVNDGLVSQTNSVIRLTKSLPKTDWVPIIIRDTIYRDGDALTPFRSPEDSTKSRGF